MDPSAPDDQNPQNQTISTPIQPGQFVVASDENIQSSGISASQPPPPVQPEPIQADNSAAGQETGEPFNQSNFQVPAQTPALSQSAYGDLTFQGQSPPPVPPTQPDPTPFTPVPPQGQQAQPPSSGFPVIKIIGIAIGTISLLTIIGALVWFFILNKPTEVVPTAVEEFTEEAPTASQAPQSTFGDIPQASEEAPPQSTEPEIPPAQNPVE